MKFITTTKKVISGEILQFYEFLIKAGIISVLFCAFIQYWQYAGLLVFTDANVTRIPRMLTLHILSLLKIQFSVSIAHLFAN